MRAHAEAIHAAALRAVDARLAVRRWLRRGALPDGPVVLVGAGKAAAAMALGAVEELGPRVLGGVVVVKDGHGLDVAGVEVLEAGHPVPDARSLAAGQRLLREVAAHGPGTRFLGLWSGGASALVEVLQPGVSLPQLIEEVEGLGRAGVGIEAINAHRRTRSAIKGGRLATRGQWVNLVISDVPGDRAELVGSGPAVTEQSEDHVIATLDDAVEGAVAEAERRGWPTRVVDRAFTGAADEGGRALVRALDGIPGPGCALFAGEPTVQLGASSGRGGRMQEAALAAALELRRSGVGLWFAGTDGTDGPTDAAGAWVDAGTADRIRAAGLDPAWHLRHHDAHPALDAAGALIRTGPTRTNVRDLWFGLVAPER